MENYAKIRKIGEGAFGKANLVRHKQSNKQFVIKEINIIRMSSKEREESRKEVSVLAQLHHPNIVAYRESFEEHGNLYIVMDFCAGGDLYNKINSQRGILFSEDQVLDWFVQMCLAIKHIHDRKILHRDIKSQNIFLSNRGEVQIGDFGIAKVLNSTVELARTCIGTPYYLSPEIVENKPYNNKSDIWSLGCVLYELTTLKHAFEAGNMKNLVLKIIRGSYPPVPTKYSYDIRNLIAQLFKRSPRDRPSINTVLKKNFITQRVRKFLTEDELASEFSHTVMHGQKIARALPPPPRQEPGSRPSSAAGKRAPPKPARYDPSAVYGGSAVKKSKENRASLDKKKKNVPAPNRPISACYQDIQRKKQELIEREKKRIEEQRQKARINRSREEGWKHIVQNLGSDEPKKEIKNDDKDSAREQVKWPAHKPMENKKPLKDHGNYEQYNAYLDKLQQERGERVGQQGPAFKRPQPAPAPGVIWQRQQAEPIPGPDVIKRAQYDRKLGGEAAEQARLIEDFMQRKQQAARNKVRGQAQLLGYTPPCTPVQAKPVAKPAKVVGAQFRPPSAGKNKEEQDYLEKLRKIRQNNFAERQNKQGKLKDPKAENGRPRSAREDAEGRKKKIEALRQQAEERAQKLKDQLELKRKEILDKERKMWEKQQNKVAGERPSSAKKAADMKPAAAVAITGVLRAIGAKPTKAEDPVPRIEPEERSNLQHQKEEILKRLNEKGSPRGQWGDPEAIKKEDIPEEEPESSRLKWGGAGGDSLNLGQLPLEQTASEMEVTSARDQVIKNPDEAAAASQSRRQWGRPGSTVINALKDAPISSTTTMNSNKSDDSFSSSSQSSKEASPQPAQPAVAHAKHSVAHAIILSKDLVGKETVTITPTKENLPESNDLPCEKSETEEKEKPKTNLKSDQLKEELNPENQSEEDHSESNIKNIQLKSEIIHDTLESKEKQIDQSGDLPVTKSQLEDNTSSQTIEKVASSEIKSVGGRSTTENNGKPPVLPKPEIVEKPKVNSATITLAKPVLLPKPDVPMDFGSKLPKVVRSEGAGSLFDKVELDDKEDEKFEKSKKEEEIEVLVEDIEEEEKDKPTTAVLKGLSTGHFDMGDVQLLRTCSEPDLSKLSVSEIPTLKAGLISCSVGNLGAFDEDNVSENKSEVESNEGNDDESESKVTSEVNVKEVMAKDETLERDRQKSVDSQEADNEEDSDEEDIDELISVRETMKSFLLQSSDDESNRGSVRFSLSTTDDEDRGDTHAEKDHEESENEEEGSSRVNEKGDSVEFLKPNEAKEDNLDKNSSNPVSWSVSIDDENKSVTTEENDDLDLFQTDDDSDENGDEESDDYELFSRLEESRANLENQLGCTKFLKVYKTVQALQEDEDENIEEGARIAIELLGEEHEALYPRIFQLVMADAAFTEDNE